MPIYGDENSKRDYRDYVDATTNFLANRLNQGLSPEDIVDTFLEELSPEGRINLVEAFAALDLPVTVPMPGTEKTDETFMGYTLRFFQAHFVQKLVIRQRVASTSNADGPSDLSVHPGRSGADAPNQRPR